MNLTDEQREFISCALLGGNVLVDACVGSGKTTAIQHLCDEFPTTKKILYLTYNKLLKIDAKEKIKNKNVTVTNYHGFAFICLNHAGIKAGISDLIQTFNHKKPYVDHYDLLVLDEYQDIDQEIAEMLLLIKENNPDMQIVAVGDMKQKIYDKTTLNIDRFIDEFIGKHTDLEFTRCFRLSKDIAEKLGRIWNKNIVGVNPDCRVTTMRKPEIVKYLSEQDPSDVLCLGSRTGTMSDVLNKLEGRCKEKYNKSTVFASISDNRGTSATEPSKNTAIFTTYDSSKGLERKICVVFDYTESYWQTRLNKPQQKYDILRNIFCVAASRGKGEIIFVKDDEALVKEETLSKRTAMNNKFDNMQISTMFDFKYKEDVEDCYELLEIKKVRSAGEVINIDNQDEMIDLSPCIGIYQEAMYFKKYDIDRDLMMFKELHGNRNVDVNRYKSLEKKILYLTSLETNQRRYIEQVERKLVENKEKGELEQRLGTVFSKNDDSQVMCEIQFANPDSTFAFTAAGYADVVKNNTVYELKFITELQHEHFLQCASYMVALELEKGVLWNTKNDEMYEIKIPDKRTYMNAVTKAITKHRIMRFIKPSVKKELSIHYIPTNDNIFDESEFFAYGNMLS